MVPPLFQNSSKSEYPMRIPAFAEYLTSPLSPRRLHGLAALLQSWLGSSAGGVQLTIYSLILIAVILWRPSGLLGLFEDIYRRMVHARPARPKEALLDG